MSYDGKTAFIDDGNFEKLLDRFGREGKVYVPRPVANRKGGTNYSYKPRAEGEAFGYFGYRPAQTVKRFLFQGRVKVAEYPGESGEETPLSRENVFLVGAAACDVVSVRSLDAVFLQDEFTDIFYRARRENTYIISIDCTEPRETCFCTLAGHGPHPVEGYDLNLSRVDGGYIVEAGSDFGNEVMTEESRLFTDAAEERLREREDMRRETSKMVEELNREYALSRSRRDILEIQRESEDWYEHVKTCVECGTCLFGCPTCHCFLLYDQEGERGRYERVKKWDACVYGGFSRMAGGGSPRLGLMERFRHRYLHKLEYYPKNFGFEACTGCGRCIEGCMGKIDMRRVLKALDSSTVETR